MRCQLGPRKLRQISTLVPQFEVEAATVRNSPHYWAECYLTERQTGRHVVAWVNYRTGEVRLPAEGEPFSEWTDSSAR